MNRQARDLRDATGLSYTQALRIIRSEASLAIHDDTQCQVLHMKRPVFCASDIRLVEPGGLSDVPVYDCECDACEAANEGVF